MASSRIGCRVAAATFFLVIPITSFAQQDQGTPEQREACTPDAMAVRRLSARSTERRGLPSRRRAAAEPALLRRLLPAAGGRAVTGADAGSAAAEGVAQQTSTATAAAGRRGLTG